MRARPPLRRRSLLMQLFLPSALILICCVSAIGFVTHLRTQQAFGSYVTAQRAQELTARGRALAVTIVVLHREDGDWSGTQQLLEDQAASAEARLIVEDDGGTVVADSSRTAVGQRFARSANTIVLPIRRRMAPRRLGTLALVPTAGSPKAQGTFLAGLDSGLLLIGLGALGAALVLTFLAVRRLTAPLSAMTGAAARLAGGDLSQRVAVPATGDEVAVLASAFNHMATSLEETRRLRRAQTADIAHELRTPLTSVRGYLEAIQDGAVAATSAVIDSMHEEVLLLDGLMSDLQDLALAEAGQLSLHRTPHSLEPLLERAAAMQAVAARARGITLRVLPSVAPLPPMAVDAPRLSQVLRNLIANSLVHTPAGGSVALSVRGEGNWVDILVCDTGRGIAPEHLPHLFERFYRADPSRDRATGGAGIGLSVARGIVQAHGGTITVSSVVDQGTDFHIRLPREARPSDRDASYDASR